MRIVGQDHYKKGTIGIKTLKLERLRFLENVESKSVIINLKTLFFSNIQLEDVVVFYINDIQSLVFAGEVQQKEGSKKLKGFYVKSADN